MRIRPRLIALTAVLSMTPTLVTIDPVWAQAPSGLPLVATGTVLDAEGHPAPGTLQLFAWPETHALDVGDKVELLPVTTGNAGSDGAFALTAAPSPQLLSLADAQGGYLNFELRSLSGERYAVTHFSRFLDAGPRPFDLDRSTAVWRARPDEPAGPVEVRLPTAANRPAGMVVPFVSSRCGPFELKEKQRASTLVGELRTEEDTKMAQFTYGKRADSDIGVGLRFGGGAWSVSGDHHVSNSHASAVDAWAEPFSGDDLAVHTDFEYGRFEQDCYDKHTEQVRSLGWTGGGERSEVITDWGCSSAPKRFREYYGVNSGFRREEERAATYGGAADAFGFSFRARSGHSRHVRMVWEFGRNDEHVLCGDDDLPAHASRIFAGETKRPPNCRPGRPC